MNQVLIDKFYQKVKFEDVPLNKIPKPYQAEVQELLDGVEEEPKKDIALGSTGDTSEIEEVLNVLLGGE